MTNLEYTRARERTTELMGIGQRRHLTASEHEEFTRLHEGMCLACAEAIRGEALKKKSRLLVLDLTDYFVNEGTIH